MTTRETVSAILKEIKPTMDLEGIGDIVEGGYIDSLELVSLVAALSERFNVDIDIDDLTPENFNSVDGIASLMSRLLEKG